MTKNKKKVNFIVDKRGDRACVFLHGLGGDLSVWQFMQKSVVNNKYSFISIDLRGHGLSCRFNKPVLLKTFSKDIKTILDFCKIKKAVLIGHCFGGMIALDFALRFPKKTQQLILISSSYKLPLWLKIPSPLLLLMKIAKIGPKKEHVDFSQFKNSGDINIKRLFSDFIHVGSASYISIIEGFKDWNVEKKLKYLSRPILIIGGKKDIIFPIKYQKSLCKLLPKAKLKVLNTNHLAPINVSSKVKELILQDLKRP